MRNILIFSALFGSFITASAQSIGNWTEWITIYSGVQVSYKLSYCVKNGNESVIQGYSFYRTKNDIKREKCWIFFSVEFAECDGTIKTENNLKIDLGTPGINEDRGQWFTGYKVTRSYFNVEYKDYNSVPGNNTITRNNSSDNSNQQKPGLETDKRQRVQGQLNQIQQNYDENTQKIASMTSAFTGITSQLQGNLIQRNIQDLNSKRERRYNDLKNRLQQEGGTLAPCNVCTGAGTVSCGKCYGSPINTCSACSGSGTINSFGTKIACNFCSGTGKTVCDVCGGVGLKLCSDCFGAGYKLGDPDPSTGNNAGSSPGPVASVDFGYGSEDLSVTIGSQVWMSKNLNVDHFANGDIIPFAGTKEEWANAGANQKPAWCYYNNDPSTVGANGKLYNLYAFTDTRGLSPKGWHLPTKTEWMKLISFLGGVEKAGFKMKNQKGWIHNTVCASWNGSNTSRFSALPQGMRYADGSFSENATMQNEGVFWQVPTEPGNRLTLWLMGCGHSLEWMNTPFVDPSGYPVRCIKD